MRKFAMFGTATAVLGLSSIAGAATVDGTRDLAYGTALALQANATGFGDNQIAVGPPAFTPTAAAANGSELDGAYAQVTGGKLYLFFAGNLETNFNHLNIYLDTNSGGLASNSPSTGNSVTFDNGFTADRFIDINGNNDGQYVNFANLDNGTGSFVGQFSPTGAVLTAGDATAPASFQLAYDNSNLLGVTGDQTTTSSAAAALVSTGFEIAIDLAELGIDGNSIKVAALINGGGNGYLSNQTLGSLPAGTSNLANGNVDLNTFNGNQFFTVATPEPASLAVLGLGAVGLLRRRK